MFIKIVWTYKTKDTVIFIGLGALICGCGEMLSCGNLELVWNISNANSIYFALLTHHMQAYFLNIFLKTTELLLLFDYLLTV